MTARKLRRGDVVLMRFPFTSLQGAKLRPAIVVSPGLVGRDVVLVAVSSVAPAKTLATDLVVERSDPEFRLTGLRQTSVIRAHKLATVERRVIVRRLGKIGARMRDELDARLSSAVGLGSS